ncbi:uncharacterized protein PHA67_003569 [Liasis olivaceus]
MEGPLLHVLFFLVASQRGCGEHQGQMCYPLMEGSKSPLGAFYCPGLLDGADARFCCGTCSAPFCCASREKGLDPAQCPALRQVVRATSEPRPEGTSPPPPEGDGSISFLWYFIGLLIASLIIWSVCRHINTFRCSRRSCCDTQEETEMQRRPPAPVPVLGPRFPPPRPPRLLPPPPPYPDDPPPYSVRDPLAPLALPPAVTNALLRMGLATGPAQPSGAEGGAPAEPSGAEGGAPAETSGAEGGAPAETSRAEGGAPAEPSGAEGGAPAETSKAEGGAPAEPSGAEGGAPAETSKAEGGASAEPSGAEGGAPAEPSGEEGGASAEPSGDQGEASGM